MVLVGLGPEKGHDGIAAVKTVGRGSHEVGEEREAFGLGEHARCLRTPMSTHGGRAEEPELD
jgi:hypothetical protein